MIWKFQEHILIFSIVYSIEYDKITPNTMLAHYENESERATKETSLPDNPDMDKVEAFVEYVNKKAIEGDY